MRRAPILDRLDRISLDLGNARRAHSEAQAFARIRPWPFSWAWGLRAAVLGVILARVQRKAAAVREELQQAHDAVMEGHRAGRANAYRAAHLKEGARRG